MRTARRRIAAAIVLGVTVARGAGADVTVSEAQAVMKAQLKDILGTDRLVRDYATFETERGEGALLVLFVTGATEPEDVPLPDEPNCQEIVTGQALVGEYHIALVVRGKLVNEIPVPSGGPDDPPGPLGLPWRNRAGYNAEFWGQPMVGNPAAEERTRLLRLADYDGDGQAWEFRLVRSEGCGQVETLLAGYSPRQRGAVIFPFVEESGVSFWRDGVFEATTEPGSGRLTSHQACNHGDDVRHRTKFRFDPGHERWVAIGTRITRCAAH